MRRARSRTRWEHVISHGRGGIQISPGTPLYAAEQPRATSVPLLRLYRDPRHDGGSIFLKRVLKGWRSLTQNRRKHQQAISLHDFSFVYLGAVGIFHSRYQLYFSTKNQFLGGRGVKAPKSRGSVEKKSGAYLYRSARPLQNIGIDIRQTTARATVVEV